MTWNRSTLEPLLLAVEKASAAVLEVYHKGFEIQTKEDKTPVTTADLLANEILQNDLRNAFPNIPVVSEESPLPDPRSLAGFFLIDPIDGTSDFIKHSGEFTVNVAYIEHNQVVLGVISAPALGELFYGIAGQGAWFQTLNAPRKSAQALHLAHRISPQKPRSGIRVLVSVSHREPQTNALLENLPQATLLSVGSSLKFCRLAQGFADYYPRKMSLHEWDIAAGHGILKAAGGNVFLLGTTTELDYGQVHYQTSPFEAY